MAAPFSSNAVQLQAHYDEICSQMQVLPLTILPKALAATLTSLDAAAAKLAKHAASGLTVCQVCSCTRLPDQLQLQFTTSLDFHRRAVHATAARFVCGQCAAVSSCSLLLQLLTPHVGAEPDEQRSEQLQQLQLHFAAVNNAPAAVTGNPDSLALWVQELACRAYSMGVVANSLKGWTLQPAGASTHQLLQQLLRPAGKRAGPAAAAIAGKPKKAKGKQQQQEAPTPAAPAAGDKRASAQHNAVADAAGTSSKKQKKSREQPGQAGAAAAQAASPRQHTPAAGLKQHASSRKHKHATPLAAATAPSAAAATPRSSKKKAAGAGGAPMPAPQHGKVKMSSSTKQKLLKSAPR